MSTPRLIVAFIACTLAACSQAFTPVTTDQSDERFAVRSSERLAEPSIPIYVLGGSQQVGAEIIGYGIQGHAKPVWS